MTEAEWLASDDPAAMLRTYCNDWAGGSNFASPSPRKLRLWVEACRAIANDVGAWDLDTQLNAAVQHWARINNPGSKVIPSLRATLLRDIVGNPWRPIEGLSLLGYDEWRREAFCRNHLNKWRTSTVLSLADAVYETRGILDSDRLAVLADALEDAGCDNADVLQHLRGFERVPDVVYEDDTHPGLPPHSVFTTKWIPLRGPHVRGCWVIDLLTGRE